MAFGKLFAGIVAALFLLSGCCGLCGMTDPGDGYYAEDGTYYSSSGNAESEYYASEAGNYEGSDCWGSAGCTGVDDGTYSYEDYSSGSYDYYEQ